MADARNLTVQDLEFFYTGMGESPFLMQGDLIEVMKSAGAVSSSVTGILNQVYGALVWSNLMNEANLFGALPKTTWPRSGWRAKTAFATSGTNDGNDIAITETGTLPSPVYPNVELVKASPKIQSLVFDVTDVVEALATVSADDVWGASHQIRAEMGTEFIKRINQQLTHRIQEATTARNTFESLDRVVASKAEMTDESSTTTYADIYNLSRSSGTDSWADSVVLENSGTIRDLTDSLVRSLFRQTRAKGAYTNLAVTGYDTYATLLGLYMTFVRYHPMTDAKAQFGINGIQTAEGLNAGVNVAQLYDVPLIQTVDCANAGGTNEISYLYALDIGDPERYGFPRLGLSILRPVEYFESRDFVLLNKFVSRGVYRIVGELTGKFLAGQGKLRDIR